MSVPMPRRGIREDENTIIRQECTHAFSWVFSEKGAEVTLYISVFLKATYDEMPAACLPRLGGRHGSAVARLEPDDPAAASGTTHHPLPKLLQLHGLFYTWRTSVSDFVFGFSADPGHDLLEIIRKSRVASQARVDAARQVGDTVGPTEAEHGSQFMQRDLAVLAAEPSGGRSSDVRIAATRQSRTDQAEVITNRLEDGLRISCGQLTSTRKRWIRQDRPGQLPQPSDEPLRAQHPATEGFAERRGRRTLRPASTRRR